eukprot:sb/3465141/
MTPPSNHMTSPNNHMTPPSNHMASPSNRIQQPNHMTSPSNQIQQPNHMVMNHMNSPGTPISYESHMQNTGQYNSTPSHMQAYEMQPPSNHMTSPSNHIQSPNNHIPSPIDHHMTSPGNHMTSPSNHMTSPSNHITSPSNHVPSPIDHHMTSPSQIYHSPQQDYISPQHHPHHEGMVSPVTEITSPGGVSVTRHEMDNLDINRQPSPPTEQRDHQVVGGEVELEKPAKLTELHQIPGFDTLQNGETEKSFPHPVPGLGLTDTEKALADFINDYDKLSDLSSSKLDLASEFSFPNGDLGDCLLLDDILINDSPKPLLNLMNSKKQPKYRMYNSLTGDLSRLKGDLSRLKGDLLSDVGLGRESVHSQQMWGSLSYIQSDPDLVTPHLVTPRFSDRINFPRYRKVTVFDPDLVPTPI